MNKKLFLVLLILFFTRGSFVFATSAPLQKINDLYPPLKSTLPMPPSASPTAEQQPVDFLICNKLFKLDNQKLFYLTLASINANRFKIVEVQTQSGYIVFSAAQKQFLATIIEVDFKTSMLKITPCNNIYYFPVGIVQNIFKYIELNSNITIEKLKVL